MVPPLPEGPVEGGGPRSMRDGHRAVFSQERVSRQKGPKRGGRGLRASKWGGGAGRARARTECPDAALRQSGPRAGPGSGGQGRQEPSVSIRTSHFTSPRLVLPGPHLREQDCEWETARPAPGIGAEKQDGDLGFPLHPSMLLPATEVPDPTRDHRPGPTERQKPR